MAPALGAVLNKSEISDREEATIAVGQNVTAGPVYKFADNDWRNVPIDGSVTAKKIYILEKGFDNTNGSAAKTVVVYGKNTKFIGESDQAIVIKSMCRVSENAAHGGKLFQQPEPTAPNQGYVRAQAVSIRDALLKSFCQYLGHHDELAATSGIGGTDALDAETDLVFQVGRLL